MKKKILMYVVLTILAFACVGCAKKDDSDNSSSGGSSKSKYEEFVEKVVGKSWCRYTGRCTEYLCFGDNGDYSYYEACGSPVGLHDLYNVWEYDKKNDVILLKGLYDENPTQIKYNSSIEYISCDGKTLVMFIDGGERTFIKTRN